MLSVGGFVPFTTVDFPGQLSAVVFCQGCPWGCPYCHNTHLQGRGVTDPALHWSDVVETLRKRRGMLDAVVFSGGEPLIQSALPEAMATLIDFGFKIGLHTGGCLPERFKTVLPLVDWVGFDVKAPWHRYPHITKVEGSGAAAEDSLKALIASGKPYEVRTTIHPSLTSEGDIGWMQQALDSLGVTRWVHQAFRPLGCANPELV